MPGLCDFQRVLVCAEVEPGVVLAAAIQTGQAAVQVVNHPGVLHIQAGTALHNNMSLGLRSVISCSSTLNKPIKDAVTVSYPASLVILCH
jgi:hypothetical protein